MESYPMLHALEELRLLKCPIYTNQNNLQFNAGSIKIPMTFFKELEKSNTSSPSCKVHSEWQSSSSEAQH